MQWCRGGFSVWWRMYHVLVQDQTWTAWACNLKWAAAFNHRDQTASLFFSQWFGWHSTSPGRFKHWAVSHSILHSASLILEHVCLHVCVGLSLTLALRKQNFDSSRGSTDLWFAGPARWSKWPEPWCFHYKQPWPCQKVIIRILLSLSWWVYNRHQASCSKANASRKQNWDV